MAPARHRGTRSRRGGRVAAADDQDLPGADRLLGHRLERHACTLDPAPRADPCDAVRIGGAKMKELVQMESAIDGLYATLPKPLPFAPRSRFALFCCGAIGETCSST